MIFPAPTRDLVLCGMIYLVALIAGIVSALVVEGPILRVAVGDIIATIVVFSFSRRFDNSSLYDPYWSVAPIPIVIYWMTISSQGPGPVQWIVVGLVTWWSMRLSRNWLATWQGLSHEDWRYVALRESQEQRYWVVSFLGIHAMPTVLVFLGCLPLFSVLSSGDRNLGASAMVAVLVTCAAILIEGIADRQLRNFRASGNRNGNLEKGLWAWSRHPNYFGEILFWWGLLLFGIATVKDLPWWSQIGAPAITGLFLFVSIPMMERHMIERRPDYAARRAQVSALIPWRRRPLREAKRR